MKIILKSLITASLLSAIVVIAIQMLPPKPAQACARPIDAHENDYTWQKESWTGSDASFLAARLIIDNRFQESNAAERMNWLDTYRRAAYDSPQSADAQFNWAYIAFLIMRQREFQQTYEQNQQLICGIFEWMAQPSSPKSFEYTRLRFIMRAFAAEYDNLDPVQVKTDGKYESIPRGDFQDLRDGLAERLIEYAPKDILLKRYAALYTRRISMSDSMKVMKYAQEVQKAFPKRPDSYWLLAIAWRGHHSYTYGSSDIDKAISYFRRFQKMVSKSSQHWYSAEQEVSLEETSRATYKRKGWLKP